MAKLSDVKIVGVEQDVLVPSTEDPRRHVPEHRVLEMYDFGPDARGHERHVLYHLREFACATHDRFRPRCSECVTAARFPLESLRLARGIEVEPR